MTGLCFILYFLIKLLLDCLVLFGLWSMNNIMQGKTVLLSFQHLEVDRNKSLLFHLIIGFYFLSTSEKICVTSGISDRSEPKFEADINMRSISSVVLALLWPLPL